MLSPKIRKRNAGHANKTPSWQNLPLSTLAAAHYVALKMNVIGSTIARINLAGAARNLFLNPCWTAFHLPQNSKPVSVYAAPRLILSLAAKKLYNRLIIGTLLASQAFRLDKSGNILHSAAYFMNMR